MSECVGVGVAAGVKNIGVTVDKCCVVLCCVMEWRESESWMKLGLYVCPYTLYGMLSERTP